MFGLKFESDKPKSEKSFRKMESHIRYLEQQLNILKSDKVLCCSCGRNEVSIKGTWCEDCKVYFAYGV